MRFENTAVFNIQGAFRGMRNPKESWGMSDSKWHVPLRWNEDDPEPFAFQDQLGEKDITLAQKLIAGGAPHRKFLRQIFVCVDITAPMYWWKEADQQKVGTVTDSTSTMHKLATTPITIDCFEIDDYQPDVFDASPLIEQLESLRKRYIETGDKEVWKELIRWLPSSWLYKKTMTMNYENIRQMVYWRKGHKLSEWASFIEWAHQLPYADELIFYRGKENE